MPEKILQMQKHSGGLKGMESKRTVAFLAQQCAEKSIKGIVQFHGKKILKIHDVKKLTESILEIYPGLEDLMINAIELTPYAVEYRYPHATNVSLEKEDVEGAIRIADEVYTKMVSCLPTQDTLL